MLPQLRAVVEPGAGRELLREHVRDLAKFEIGALTQFCPHCGSTDHGRPRAPGVHVGLAYATGLAVLAWSPSGPLGVDVERTDAAPPPPFTPGTWTAAEAVLKLTGEGLRRDPATVRADEARLVPLADVLPLPEGYVGHLALPHPR